MLSNFLPDPLLALLQLRGALLHALVQFLVHGSQVSMRPLQIVDVGTRAKPLHDLARTTTQGFAAHQEPSVAAVCSPQAALDAVGFAAGNRIVPGVPRPLFVFWVEGGVPPTAIAFLQSQAGVFHPPLVEVNVEAIGGARPDHLWNQFGQGAKVCFTLLQRCLRSVALCDIDPHLQNKGRSVGIGKRKVVNVVMATIRPDPLPFQGLLCVKNLEGLANLARLGAAKQELKTALARRFAEALLELLIGESHVIVGSQQHDIGEEQYVTQLINNTKKKKKKTNCCDDCGGC